ncbi:DUF2306 domain-containing protein [Pseudooceanicola sp. C21-150M6]
MSLAPLLAEGPVAVIHTILAVMAFLLGLVQMALRKGTRRHRMAGYVWLGLMAVVALTSFWIHTIRTFGPFSAIHLLSTLTLIVIVYGIWTARTHRVQAHRRSMIFLFVGALVIAGGFTFLPDRAIHDMFFGASQ